jgi:hypothetical protein
MIFVINFGLEKVPQNFIIFEKVEDDSNYEKTLVDRTNYIRVSTTLILRCLKKQICKKISSNFNVLKSTWQTVTNGKIQFSYLQGLLKK